MHYHLEIIMPPTDDVEAAVGKILAPFDENYDGEEGISPRWWDWWVLGGRWSGSKLISLVGDMQPFYDELNRRGVTVSSFRAGKHTLQPASQATLVDQIWNEFYPNSPVK